ncbi:hypothetical protein [Methylomonas fluvii]|uniref:Uncharacterized protein n=1 Tax=Methylomonas fluvii TaxID=1854564 RepID=A0ABR9DJR0_9GAMM|nr:hypothetical protein [Methylomonas fluvii]MBD9362122.1 hypothetical protein [Methylomonas fluvii]
MAELLFIATTIFVAYVVFVVMGGKKEKPETSKPEPAKPAIQTELAPPPPAAVKTTAKPAPAKAATPKPAAPKASKSAPAKKAAAPTPAAPVDSLKNPKTGEVAKVPASYAFAKRWIKDALVEEGLLDKVYKNNELDNAANAKIQAALQQLKGMSKYQ